MAALAPGGAHPAIIWGAIIGAESPDLDIVVRFVKGEVGYLKAHRGPTHGLATLPIQAILIAGLLTLLMPTAPFWTVFWFTLLGCLSHVLFDSANDYGTQGLWPFSPQRIAMDILPIIDLRVLGIIGIGWLLNWALPVSRVALFAGVWVALAAYVIARYRQYQRARAVVLKRIELQPDPDQRAGAGRGWQAERVSIHPTLLAWNAWRYVVQQPGEFWTGLVWVREQKVSQPEKAANQYDQLVLASLKASTVTAFAEWARRPRVQVTSQEGLHEVRWSDMRYEADNYSPFTAYAWLDESLTLIDEGLKGRQATQPDRAMLRRRLKREMGVLEP